MRVAVAADHAGFQLKQAMLDHLASEGYQVSDLGTENEESVDYPDFAAAIAREIIAGRADRAILICGSGVGASVAANKFPGVRASLCHDAYSARQGVEDDDANVLCLGARVVGEMLAFDLADHFLSARFKALPRYKRRLAKIAEIERECGMLHPDELSPRRDG